MFAANLSGQEMGRSRYAALSLESLQNHPHWRCTKRLNLREFTTSAKGVNGDWQGIAPQSLPELRNIKKE
jgi:hypothetical protein